MPEYEFLESRLEEGGAGGVEFRCTAEYHPGRGVWVGRYRMEEHLKNWYMAHNISPLSAERVVRELHQAAIGRTFHGQEDSDN